jgi:SSS family solute:Na+ symporter
MNSISTLVVRDFLVQFRKTTSEPAQVSLGRIAIVVSTPLAIAAAYLIYTTPEGLYKYLQAISIYLVMPITPAIFFGILSKRVTVQGAVASVIAGSALAMLFVVDQLIGVATAAHLFPWLHRNLTLNYTYRGLWGTIVTTAILFLVSALTGPRQRRDLKNLTVDWSAPTESFRGISDWRLQLAVLGIATIALYAWTW